MASFTGSANWYKSANEYIGDGTIDLDGHVNIKLSLTTSATEPDPDADTVYLDLGTQASNYTEVVLPNITWTRSGAVCTFSCDNIVITASGGTCTARYWHIYDDDTTGVVDALICYGIINTAGGAQGTDVVIGNTETLTLEVPVGGLFTYTQT